MAARKSCRASWSSTFVSRSRAALAASSSIMAIRRAAPGAGAGRRLARGRLITPGPEEPEVLRTEEPIQRGRPALHGAGELEQTGGALLASTNGPFLELRKGA